MNADIGWTALAVVWGGVFFLSKLMTGWLIINLTVAVHLDRERKDDRTDFLAVKVILEKGSTDSLWLQHVHGRVRPADGPGAKHLDLTQELHRLFIQQGEIDWDRHAEGGKKMMLSPGEVLQIARVVEVPADQPVMVDIAVIGMRTFWIPGFQWRASAASLPKTSTARAS